MKIKELTTKSAADLRKMLVEKQEALRNFRFGVVGSKTRNVREGRVLRKDIAKIMTLINNPSSN